MKHILQSPFTIHDSIAILPEYIHIVKEALCRHIKAAINAEPSIKIDSWDETLLNTQDNAEITQQVNINPTNEGNAHVNHCYYGYASDVKLYSMTEAAKILGIGRNKLTSKLREVGILGTGIENNKPVEYYVQQGYFQYTTRDDGISYTPLVTDTGIDFLAELLTGHPEWFPGK